MPTGNARPTSVPHSALDEARLALRVWMRGQQPSRDHPGVVLGDCLDRLEEQLEATQRAISVGEYAYAGLRKRMEGENNGLREQFGSLHDAAQMVDNCNEGADNEPCAWCLAKLHDALASIPAKSQNWRYGEGRLLPEEQSPAKKPT